ncbi:MAG: hypothetical protein ACMG57_01915 [Candidatus Dojkabacteria bacterium]
MDNDLLIIEKQGEVNYDSYVLSGLQELGLNTKFEMIFFLSKVYVESKFDDKGKGYNHLVSLAIGKLSKKYNLDEPEGYRAKLDQLIENLMGVLDGENYMLKRLNEFYLWTRQIRGKENNSTN